MEDFANSYVPKTTQMNTIPSFESSFSMRNYKRTILNPFSENSFELASQEEQFSPLDKLRKEKTLRTIMYNSPSPSKKQRLCSRFPKSTLMPLSKESQSIMASPPIVKKKKLESPDLFAWV